MKRIRPLIIYLPIVGVIFCLGIPSRTIGDHLPSWYVNYFGDFLWAMMLFFLCGVVFRQSTRRTFIVTLAFTWFIEFTQLYHAPWIDGLRNIKIFALILGHGFLWTDLLAYTVGISLGAIIDQAIIKKRTEA
jgi:hypothetical protein